MSHPSWVCGLKQGWDVRRPFDKRSHPSWVCGLKQILNVQSLNLLKSHPSWVCGLKLDIFPDRACRFCESHPSWVCGLKQRCVGKIRVQRKVTPFVGVWIETLWKESTVPSWLVTPFVGVWIETNSRSDFSC